MVSRSFPAIGIEALGPTDNLKLITHVLPSLRPHDLLIRIQAVALNPIDSIKRNIILFGPAPTPENPLILGWDASGIVEEVGSEVSLYKKGDEVFFAGDASRPGCNAQFMAIDERIVGIKPKTLSWGEAAAVPLTGITVWESIEESMGVSLSNKESNKNKVILFIAGAGGIGSIGIQLAKIVFGLTVVATASRKESIEYCKKMGADYVINHKNNLKSELENVGLKGVDYILCGAFFNEAVYEQCAEILNTLGNIVVITPSEKIDVFKLFVKRGRISGETMFSRPLVGSDLEKQKKILDTISKMLDEKQIVSTLQKLDKFSLDNLKEEHKNLEKGTNIGKTVLDGVQEYFANL